MRPAHIYANLTPTQHNDLITALHGHWRIATRIVMILLSEAPRGFRTGDQLGSSSGK
jgi:hypothetical protein